MQPETLSQWLAWLGQLHPERIDLSLDRMRVVARRLCLPRSPAPLNIIVAGTNGKGSCVAFLAAILRAQGLRVGCYTSPHLHSVCERIVIADQPVDEEALCAALQHVENRRGDSPLTEFEFLSLAALLLLADAELDVAVLEVGLGGRLDAVNIIDAEGAIISSIDFDHTRWLGDSRASIAREKCGVMRAGQQVVYAPTDRLTAVERYAKQHGARLIQGGVDYSWCAMPNAWRWWNAQEHLQPLPLPALLGRHQLQNAAAVIALLKALPSTSSMDLSGLVNGLETAKLAGRLELFEGPVSCVLDVAHNPAGAAVLAGFLSERPVLGRNLAVCGMLPDKDAQAMVAALQHQINQWFIAPPNEAEAGSHRRFELANQLGPLADASYLDIMSAWRAAVAAAHHTDRIVVFGSFQVVAPIRAAILAAQSSFRAIREPAWVMR